VCVCVGVCVCKGPIKRMSITSPGVESKAAFF
jgi:hypothetical protein